MPPTSAIRMMETPAQIARPCLVSPIGKSCTQASHSGILWVPTTLSMTTFSGHGARRVMPVSTSIARKTMMSHFLYGRTISVTRLSMV